MIQNVGKSAIFLYKKKFKKGKEKMRIIFIKYKHIMISFNKKKRKKKTN